MEDFEIVTDFKNLYKAYKKAKVGKGFRNSSARFTIHSFDGIHSLKKQLEDRTYKVSGYHDFMVYEPKERLVKACSYKDKVVQHSLCDNVLLPTLQREFIKDNYAGQIGKGTLFGLNRLGEQMQEFYKEHGLNGWILKCDISKFFYSIVHDCLKDILDYYFENEGIRWLNHLLVDSIDNPGVPLGNQSGQVYSLIYLNGLDKFITGELGIKYYGRYIDDFYLIHWDKAYLKECLGNIYEFVGTLGLSLNSKTQIIHFKNGINFTGFHTYVTTNGMVIRKLNNANKRNAKKKYGRMAKLVKEGKLSKKKFDECYGAWKSHIAHGNCVKLAHSMDLYIESILKFNGG